MCGYYITIINKYPTIYHLADADLNFLRDIFKQIGLFYRADRLKQISTLIVEEYEGKIPRDRDELIKIKGIGDYICNCILCFGYNEKYAIVDTNVIRIFNRIFNYKSTVKRPHTDKKLWKFAETIVPHTDYVDYNYALLDFASLVCTFKDPKCNECNMNRICNMYMKLN